MNQETLDTLIGTPPPSTVDVDRIVVRQRRRQRWRRVAASGSAAVAVVVAVAVGLSLTGGPRQRPVAATSAPAQPVGTPGATAGAPGFVLETGTAAGRQRTVDRLRAALEAATAKHAAGAEWIYMPDVPGERRTPDGRPVLRATGDPVTFEGRSGIVAGGRRGGFYLSVRPEGCQPNGVCFATRECDRMLASCASLRTPGGLPAIHWVDRPNGKYVFYGVHVTLRDGEHALTLQAVNYFGGDASPVSAAVPALTRNQLDAIAAGIADRITA